MAAAHARRLAVGELVALEPIRDEPTLLVVPAVFLKPRGGVALGAGGVVAKQLGRKPWQLLLPRGVRRFEAAGNPRRIGDRLHGVAVPSAGNQETVHGIIQNRFVGQGVLIAPLVARRRQRRETILHRAALGRLVAVPGPLRTIRIVFKD